jgi:hypothetical protein
MYYGSTHIISYGLNGNVGIGTSSPSQKLTLSNGTFQINGSSSFSSNVEIGRVGSDNNMAFATGGLERMRIDTSGNLLVGTTDIAPFDNSSNSSADNGIALRSDGILAVAAYKSTANSGNVLTANRTGTDGPIIGLQKSGITVGSIGVSGANLTIGSSAAGKSGVYFGDNAIFPMRSGALATAAINFGSPGYRFKDLYLSNSAIVGGGGTSQTGVISFVADSERARIEGGYQSGGGGYLKFNTDTAGGSNLERMRIDSSGNLLVGTTGLPVANGKLSVAGASRFLESTDAASPIACDKVGAGTTATQRFVVFTVASQSTGSGQINANGASQAAFGTFSDATLKENIVNLPDQYENIRALRPVEFDYIESEGGGHQVGFIAQEMQEVYPCCVGEREDGKLTVGGWNKTEARLVSALQSAMNKIDALTARLEALEGA